MRASICQPESSAVTLEFKRQRKRSIEFNQDNGVRKSVWNKLNGRLGIGKYQELMNIKRGQL